MGSKHMLPCSPRFATEKKCSTLPCVLSHGGYLLWRTCLRSPRVLTRPQFQRKTYGDKGSDDEDDDSDDHDLM